MSIQALRERHSALAKSIENLLDKNVNPTWNGDLEAQYKAQLAEMDTIAADISRQNTFRARMTEHANAGGGQISDDVRNQFTRTPGAHSDDVAGMRAFLAGGVANMSEEARSRMQARQSHDIRNAMSTTTGSEGGYTVAPEYFGELTAAMRAYGGVRAVARTIQSASGAVLNFPTADATAEVGEIVGQSQSASAADTTFGNSTLEVFKYSSKVIAVPFELIQDSMFDIQGYVQALLALRIGRITAQHFAVGSGVGQPRGLITAAAVGKAAASGQVASITYEDLVDLEHSVDPAYRTAAGWMMHDSTLRVIRKIKDDEGRPIFVPGYEQGNPGGAPDRLMGRAIQICQEMPVMAANAKSLAFGDFSKYFVREVMDLTLFRFTDSVYASKGQTGFLAFNRQGGNLIDVGGAVKVYQNSAT